MNERSPPRLVRHLRLAALLLVSACSAGRGPEASEPPLKGARIGGPFALIDQNGRRVTDRDFAGKYRIMYFGFTHCPDVCPTDLAAITRALKAFEGKDPARAAKVVPIFVTVDPERDTPPVMKEYVASFHPRMVALTGAPEDVAKVSKEYAVWSEKGEPQPGGGYNVNHSRAEILMDPSGEPVALLPDDKGVDGITAELDRWVK
jgi:protein SCO1/2